MLIQKFVSWWRYQVYGDVPGTWGYTMCLSMLASGAVVPPSTRY